MFVDAAGQQVVERDHLAALGEQPRAEVRADEAGAAGDEDAPRPISAWSMRPSGVPRERENAANAGRPSRRPASRAASRRAIRRARCRAPTTPAAALGRRARWSRSGRSRGRRSRPRRARSARAPTSSRARRSRHERAARAAPRPAATIAVREVDRVGRPADLVVDHPQRARRGARAPRRGLVEHRGDEVAAAPEHPAGAHHQELARRREHRALARELGAAVDRARRRSDRPRDTGGARRPRTRSRSRRGRGARPASAHARASTAGARALPRRASAGSRSQRSTWVKAAAFTQTSGRGSAREPRRAPRGRRDVELRRGRRPTPAPRAARRSSSAEPS